MDEDIKKYDCDICLKSYSSRQNLWRHKNKEHEREENIDENKCICNYCNKIFSRSDNLSRHLAICKKAKDKCVQLEEQIKNLKGEFDEREKKLKEKLKEELKEEIKKELKTNLLSKAKIHPKTLQKINNQLNQIGCNNNNSNFIFSFGKEQNVSTLISDEKKIEILNRRLNSITYLIEYMHFNDDLPQFKNILITNMQNNIGYIYDQDKKKFITVNKDDLLETIIDMRMIDIEDFYKACKSKLSETTIKKLDLLMEDINKDKFRDDKKNQIKLIIYNNKEKINNAIA